MAQVPTPLPNFGSEQVGAQGTLDLPANPWGEEWEHIIDGRDQTHKLWVDGGTERMRNVLIMNNNIHDLKNEVEYVLRVERCTNVLIINNIGVTQRWLI